MAFVLYRFRKKKKNIFYLYKYYYCLEEKMRGANTNMNISAPAPLNPREKSLEDYRKRLKEHKELSAKLKQSKNILYD